MTGAKRPLVSVVTVVYNAAATIEETIKSVVSQTYDNIDFVIIDGGSTDATLRIVEQYRTRIAHLSSGKDKGIYDAMNRGIAAARGEWILFLNSGDTFASSDVLSDVFSAPPPSDADVLYGSTLLKSSRRIMHPPARISKGYFYFETLCHQSVLVRRGLFDRVGTFHLDYRIIADREFLLRATNAGSRFARTNVVVSVWDPEGFSMANAAVSIRENADFQARYFTRAERATLPWLMRFKNLGRKLGRVLTRSGENAITHG